MKKVKLDSLIILILTVFSFSASGVEEKSDSNPAPMQKLTNLGQVLLGDEEPLQVQPHLYNPRRLINLHDVQKEVLNSGVKEEEQEENQAEKPE